MAKKKIKAEPAPKMLADEINDIIDPVKDRLSSLEKSQKEDKRLEFIVVTSTVLIAILTIFQTYLIYNQNNLFESQNERIVQQTYLQEAERRSSLINLLSNTLDKVEETLNDSPSANRSLPPSLVSRISTLTIYLKPYKLLEGDSLTTESLSPERGHILINLLNYKLSDSTLDAIFSTAQFEAADLRFMKFFNNYLKRVDLQYANLKQAIIYDCNLDAMFAPGVVFDSSNISESDFNGALLNFSSFKAATLINNNFSNCLMDSIILDDALIDRIDWFDYLSNNNNKGIEWIKKHYEINKTPIIHTDMRQKQINVYRIKKLKT